MNHWKKCSKFLFGTSCRLEKTAPRDYRGAVLRVMALPMGTYQPEPSLRGVCPTAVTILPVGPGWPARVQLLPSVAISVA